MDNLHELDINELKSIIKGAGLSEELHARVVYNYKHDRVIIPRKNDTWAIDLIDSTEFYKYNGGYNFIFICIDAFTKYVWAIPILTKSPDNTTRAMSSIFKQNGTAPKYIWSDQGLEFTAGEFPALLAKYKVKLYHTQNYKLKSVFAERVIQTLKNILISRIEKIHGYTYTDLDGENLHIKQETSQQKKRRLEIIQEEKKAYREENDLALINNPPILEEKEDITPLPPNPDKPIKKHSKQVSNIKSRSKQNIIDVMDGIYSIAEPLIKSSSMDHIIKVIKVAFKQYREQNPDYKPSPSTLNNLINPSRLVKNSRKGVLARLITYSKTL
jgi:hypothetical protein